MKHTGYKWLPWLDECPECGSSENKVWTIADVGAHDGDDVRCIECGHAGHVSADEDGCYTVWDDEAIDDAQGMPK